MTAENATPDPDKPSPDKPRPGRTEPGQGRRNSGRAAQQSNAEGRFGTPGPPLDRRNPFLIGFVGGLGRAARVRRSFLGVRNAASILVLDLRRAVPGDRPEPGGQPAAQLGPAARRSPSAVVALIGLVRCLPAASSRWSRRWSRRPAQLINNMPGLHREPAAQRDDQRPGPALRHHQQGAERDQRRARSATRLGGVVGGGRLLFGTLFNVLTVLVLTIYFMASFDRIKERRLRAGARGPAGSGSRLLTDEILTKVGAYMVGRPRDRGAGRREHVRVRDDRRAGLPVRAGRRGRRLRPDPADRRDPRRGRRQPGRAWPSSLTDRHRLRRLLRHLPAGGELPDLSEGDAPLGQGQRRGRGGRGAARASACSG